MFHQFLKFIVRCKYINSLLWNQKFNTLFSIDVHAARNNLTPSPAILANSRIMYFSNIPSSGQSSEPANEMTVRPLLFTELEEFPRNVDDGFGFGTVKTTLILRCIGQISIHLLALPIARF